MTINSYKRFVTLEEYLKFKKELYLMGKARSFSDDANDTVYQTGINSENYVMG